MGCTQLLWSVVVGFVVGALARWLLPGAHPMGFLLTTGLGIVGSLVGGVIGGLLSKPKEGARFHPAGFFLSLVGAMLVLYLWSKFA